MIPGHREADPPVRAFSIRQPWASLILEGQKPVENRTWSTGYRGPLVVHAGRQVDRSAVYLTVRYGLADAPTGAYLGVVDLVDVHHATDTACSCGPWAEPGVYHWLLDRPRWLTNPIPGPGRLQLYRPPDEVLSACLVVLCQPSWWAAESGPGSSIPEPPPGGVVISEGVRLVCAEPCWETTEVTWRRFTVHRSTPGGERQIGSGDYWACHTCRYVLLGEIGFLDEEQRRGRGTRVLEHLRGEVMGYRWCLTPIKRASKPFWERLQEVYPGDYHIDPVYAGEAPETPRALSVAARGGPPCPDRALVHGRRLPGADRRDGAVRSTGETIPDRARSIGFLVAVLDPLQP